MTSAVNWRTGRDLLARSVTNTGVSQLAALSLYIVFVIQHCFLLIYSYVFSCMLDYFNVSGIHQTGMD